MRSEAAKEPTPAPPPGPWMVPPLDRREVAKQRERMALVGLALLSAGCALVYPPAGLIAPGLYLLIISFPRRR